jgi:hypothetical protein
MDFFFYAPNHDVEQMMSIWQYVIPYTKHIVTKDGKELGLAKEGDVIVILGHGSEARRDAPDGADVRSLHTRPAWYSSRNPFNVEEASIRIDDLPEALTSRGLKPAKYTFFFCACFAGQDGIKANDNPFSSERVPWTPNIEVFANALSKKGRGFAGSAVFGPTGPIVRDLTSSAHYRTISYSDWVRRDRALVKCVFHQRNISLADARAIPDIITMRTCPVPPTQAELMLQARDFLGPNFLGR